MAELDQLGSRLAAALGHGPDRVPSWRGLLSALLPRSALKTLDLPVEAAMRLVLTGGLSGGAN